MPNRVIQGGAGPGSKVGTEALVDALRGALRFSISPPDHSDANNNLLGFYKAGQISGAVVSLGAAGHLASFRWTDTTRVAVLIRIRAGWVVNAAITAATAMDMQAVMARGFTVDFTTNSTQISLAAVTNTNKMRANMGTTILGALGPRILTTAAMSGQTLTADAAPFAYTVWVNQPSGNATVTQALGVGGAMQTLYEWTPIEHPVVLGANEGVLLQPVTAGPVTGSVKYYTQWEWAEFALF